MEDEMSESEEARIDDGVMSLPALLMDFERFGIKLGVTLVHSPDELLTDQHRAALRQHHTALLVHLSRRQQWAVGPGPPGGA
jgi:hypothetical protein